MKIEKFKKVKSIYCEQGKRGKQNVNNKKCMDLSVFCIALAGNFKKESNHRPANTVCIKSSSWLYIQTAKLTYKHISQQFCF